MSDYVIHLEDGRLAGGSDAAHVDKIVAAACASQQIAIHFHGGLVDQADGLAITNRLAPRYCAAGAYPLFFIWEAGLLEIVPNRLRSIAQEGIFRALWERIARLASRKLAQDEQTRAAGTLSSLFDEEPARSIRPALESARTERLAIPETLRVASPLTQAEELVARTELERDLALQAELGALDPVPPDDGARGPAPLRARAASLIDPAVLESLRSGAAPGTRGLLSGAKLATLAVEVLRRVVQRFWSERDHGFHATIVEELLRALYLANVGKATWDLIKSNTAQAFGPDAALYGGTALVDALRRHLGSHRPRITLIGHSTGAIYISDLLDHAANVLPADVKFEIVFLAAASTFTRTATSLRSHAARISELRAFAMTDENERGDPLVPVVYPHSLLYFVSGVLEDEVDAPIVGMQRYFTGTQYRAGGFPAVDAVCSYFSGPPDRSVWSKADLSNGRRSESLKHGDFDNDEATLKSLEHVLRSGF